LQASQVQEFPVFPVMLVKLRILWHVGVHCDLLCNN